MSSSKFANLEGVDFDSPDVYETHSPSPETRTRKLGRSNRGRASTSSDEDSDDDEGGHSDSGERSGRRGTKKVGGQDGLQGDENPDIVATALNPDEAAKRFQDASGVDGRSVDFSSAIHKRKKRPQYYPAPIFETATYALGSGIGYQTSGGGLGPGDEEPWTKVSSMNEKPIDRFRRLRYEVEELEKELKSEANGNGAVPDAREGIKEEEEEHPPPGLLLQLSGLKGQLSSIDERGFGAKSAASTSWNVETRRLLDRLSLRGEMDNGGKGQMEVRHAAVGESDPSSSEGIAKLAELDKRLAGLEELVGVREAFADETKTLPLPLLPSLARIEHLLTLLTHPRHLDGISRRIKVLVSELERLHEARRKLASVGHQNQLQQIGEDRKGVNGDASSSSSPQTVTLPIETMQKLDTVLPTLSKLDPLIPLVPALLARLNSLAALHASSNSFAQDMDTLETSMKRSHLNADELKSMLGNLETSFAENASRIQDNFKVVEARMESITQRVEKLSPSSK